MKKLKIRLIKYIVRRVLISDNPEYLRELTKELLRGKTESKVKVFRPLLKSLANTSNCSVNKDWGDQADSITYTPSKRTGRKRHAKL